MTGESLDLTERGKMACAWISKARAKRIVRAYPELDGRLTEDQGTGRRRGGCYAMNAVGRLRDAGEHQLAEALLTAANEIR